MDRGQRYRAAGWLAGLTLGAGAPAAMAATTPIGPPFANEDSHEEIFEALYGGSFSSSGLDFSNGTVTAQRVDDDDDQTFSFDLPVSAEARAVFADFEQAFGFLPGSSGGSFQELFEVDGYGYAVTGSRTVTLDGEVRFARDESRGVLASSNPDDNVDGVDHMVTYQILGLEGAFDDVFVVFFEDLRADRSDFDYQDLVVELTLIPTPAALTAGLGLLGGIVMRRRG